MPTLISPLNKNNIIIDKNKTNNGDSDRDSNGNSGNDNDGVNENYIAKMTYI